MGVCDPSIVKELLAAGRFCLERNAFDALPRFFCSRLYSQSRPNTKGKHLLAGFNLLEEFKLLTNAMFARALAIALGAELVASIAGS